MYQCNGFTQYFPSQRISLEIKKESIQLRKIHKQNKVKQTQSKLTHFQIQSRHPWIDQEGNFTEEAALHFKLLTSCCDRTTVQMVSTPKRLKTCCRSTLLIWQIKESVKLLEESTLCCLAVKKKTQKTDFYLNNTRFQTVYYRNCSILNPTDNLRRIIWGFY